MSKPWPAEMVAIHREVLADQLRTEVDIDVRGCHNWRGAKTERGYGLIRVRDKTTGAHRLAWELTRGPIPAGLFVCHRCDNPSCLNVDHLFLGTAADNNADCRAKGRRPKTYRRRNVSRGKAMHEGCEK